VVCLLRTIDIAVLKTAQPSRDAVGEGGECSAFHQGGVVLLLSTAHLGQMGD
jgi:hypothetical protein